MSIPVNFEYPGVRNCAICGEEGASYHFGAVSCHGCKAFFRRTVRRRIEYVCLLDGTCEVSGARRSECRRCRFERCLRAGMKSTGVQPKRSPPKNASKSAASYEKSSKEVSDDEATSIDIIDLETEIAPRFVPQSQSIITMVSTPGLIPVVTPGLTRGVTPGLTPNLVPGQTPEPGGLPFGSLPSTSLLSLPSGLELPLDSYAHHYAYPHSDSNLYCHPNCLLCSNHHVYPSPHSYYQPQTDAPLAAQNISKERSIFGGSLYCAFMEVNPRNRISDGFDYRTTIQKLLAMEKLINSTLEQITLECTQLVPYGAAYMRQNLHRLMRMDLETRVTVLKEFGIFSTLPLNDQVALLQNGCFDTKAFADFQRSNSSTDDVIDLFDGRHKLTRKEAPKSSLLALDQTFEILKAYRSMEVDWVEYCCLTAIMFWDPDVCGQDTKSLVRARRTLFIASLEAYEHTKGSSSSQRFASLIMFLHSFKELTKASKEGLQRIQLRPGFLDFDPLIDQLMSKPTGIDEDGIRFRNALHS